MPNINIPNVGQEYISHNTWAFTNTGEAKLRHVLMLATKWRALDLNISRLEIEKRSLVFELDELEKRAKVARPVLPPYKSEIKACCICKHPISKLAKVCRHCTSTQLDYLDVVAKQTIIASSAVAKAIPCDSNEAKHQGMCVFCHSRIQTSAIRCYKCNRCQPEFLLEMLKFKSYEKNAIVKEAAKHD